MHLYRGKCLFILLVIISLLGGVCLPEGRAVMATEQGSPGGTDGSPGATDGSPGETDGSPGAANQENPQEPEVTPSAMPTDEPEPTPSAMPTDEPEKYTLLNEDAKYYSGGQKGIKYKKVKGTKVYHILSYTTDTVKLHMSKKSIFTVYGGGSKKELKQELATVSKKGVVKCHRRGAGETLAVIIQAEAKETGEIQYIYIFFQKKLTCKNGSRVTMYEKHSEQLRFDYPKKDLEFSVKNKKRAVVNKKGRVTGVRHGTTYVTVKVKGSQNNQVQIKIVVRIEPWIVSAKDKIYDYNNLTTDLYRLRRKYGGKTGVFSLGKSWDNRNIWCLRIGNANAPRRLVIDAAIHAREWKNTQLVMRQAEEILRDYSEFRSRFTGVCIYIIPMANPDGASLAQYGPSVIRNKKLQKRCRKIGHFKTWKNNARGVNLNYNFPSGFKKKHKAKKPDHLSYPGKKKGSEKETRALMYFFERIRPTTVLNVHSTGSVIYWNFNVTGAQYQRLYNFAAKIRSLNNYRMMPKGGSTNANGGLADWLNYSRGVTSVTIETGTVPCPLPHSQFAAIYKRNNKMFRWFMTKY